MLILSKNHLSLTLLASFAITPILEAKPGLESTALQNSKAPQTITSKTRNKIGGIEYEILKEAPTGAREPIKTQSVSVLYTGWLNDNGKPGKKFDSSLNPAKPFTFIVGVGKVIQGWDTMVMNMKVGQKVRVYIPTALAYGTRGAGTVIPGGADLIFEIELLSIN